jgi:hypothetical protein
MTANRTISKSVRQVLTALAKAKGPMTRSQVADHAEKAGDSLHAGRIAQESATYAGLVADGEIKMVEIEDETCYSITAKGRKLLADAFSI